MKPVVKNLTFIGLIFEGLSLLFLLFILFLSYQPWVMSLLESEFPQEVVWLDLIRALMIFVTIVAALFFTLNLYLFTPIIKGEASESTGSKLLYQAIYGAINLAFNQILGILYLASGILGYNQFEKDKNPVREGL